MSVRRHSALSTRTRKAVAIVAQQLGCSEDEALGRLVERAGIGQYRLHDYAGLVVDGMIRFEPVEPPTAPSGSGLAHVDD
jgi:hypothetical protein